MVSTIALVRLEGFAWTALAPPPRHFLFPTLTWNSDSQLLLQLPL
jgi:hypothetical protein